jgi:hypothetical protein
MPPFRMPDGTFIDAPTYAAASALHKAKKAPAQQGVPAPPVVTPQAGFTATVTPEDNFAGRSMTKFGVGERVDLGFTTLPAQTAASFGGLNWAVKSGPGTVANNPGNLGTARLTMGDTSGAVVLELRTVGAQPIVKLTKTLWVVEPTGAVMTREPNTGIYHQTGVASAGFYGWIWLRPVEVSFYRCEFREGSATPRATGSMALTIATTAPTADAKGQKAAVTSELSSLKGARHPVMGSWISITTGHSVNGSRMNGHDNVNSASFNPPFAAGTFDWDIPWLFRVIGSQKEKIFFTATHSEVVDNFGRMTISKAGTTISCNAADPTSAK